MANNYHFFLRTKAKLAPQLLRSLTHRLRSRGVDAFLTIPSFFNHRKIDEVPEFRLQNLGGAADVARLRRVLLRKREQQDATCALQRRSETVLGSQDSAPHRRRADQVDVDVFGERCIEGFAPGHAEIREDGIRTLLVLSHRLKLVVALAVTDEVDLRGHDAGFAKIECFRKRCKRKRGKGGN